MSSPSIDPWEVPDVSRDVPNSEPIPHGIDGLVPIVRQCLAVNGLAVSDETLAELSVTRDLSMPAQHVMRIRVRMTRGFTATIEARWIDPGHTVLGYNLMSVMMRRREDGLWPTRPILASETSSEPSGESSAQSLEGSSVSQRSPTAEEDDPPETPSNLQIAVDPERDEGTIVLIREGFLHRHSSTSPQGSTCRPDDTPPSTTPGREQRVIDLGSHP